MKQSDKVIYPNRSFSSALSNAYKDVFDGTKATTDIRTTPDLQGLFLEIPTAQTPNYGSGEVVGYKLGLYVNSINNEGSPSIAIWKAKQGITNHEGKFGQNIVTDIYSMCSFPSDQPSTLWMENFGNLQDPGSHYHVGASTVTISTDPYLDVYEAFQTKRINGGTKLGIMSIDHFISTYASPLTPSPNEERLGIFVERVMDKYEGNLTPKVDTGELVEGFKEMVSFGNGWGISTIGGAITDPEYKWRPVGHTVSLLDFVDVPYWKDDPDNDRPLDCALRYSFERTHKIEKEVPSVKAFVNANQVSFDEIRTNNHRYYRVDNEDNAEMFFENGLYFNDRDVKQGGFSLNLKHLYKSGLTDGNGGTLNDDGMSLGTLERSNGFNTLIKKNIPIGMHMTKPAEYTGTQVLSDSSANRSRQKVVFNVKFKSFPNIVSDGAKTNGAAFPSRGFAIWFKNRTYDGKRNENEIADDIYTHCYKQDQTNFEALSDTAGHMHSAFCGFILYRTGNQFHVKSIGKAAVGFNADSGDTQQLGRQLLFHPTTEDSANGRVKLDEDLIGKWLQMVLTFDPDGNGFKLNILDENGDAIGAEVACGATDGTTANNIRGWPIMSIGSSCTGANVTYANAFQAGSSQGWRGNFTGTGLAAADAETNGQSDNSDCEFDMLIDSCFITKSGSNYKHLNNTFTNLSADQLPIRHVSVVDDTVAIASGGKGASVEDSTGMTTPVFWSFGTKVASELYPEHNGAPKYLWFNGFGCDDFTNNTAIDNKYIRWAYSTDQVKLGQQLWGYNNAGTVDAATGTLANITSQDAGRFVNGGGSGINRIYHSSAEITAEGNSFITDRLSCEHFTQKGHIAYATTDVTDSDSMKNTLVRRENIFCSARVDSFKHSTDDYRLSIDDTKIISNVDDKEEEYILYVKDARNAPTNYKSGMKLNFKTGNTLTFKDKANYTDAHTTLRDSNLTSNGTTVSITASGDRYTWGSTSGIKLVDGTTINPQDYFNLGDHITVSGCSDAANNGDFVVDELAATYIGVTGSLATEVVADGVIRIKKRVGYPDIMITDSSDVRYDEGLRVFLSPYRFWMYAEIFNYDFTNSEKVKLPDKKYDSVVITDLCPDTDKTSGSLNFGVDDFGATWNEFIITDSANLDNQWDLTRFALSKGVLVTDTDFGNGVFNPELIAGEADRGGYVKKHTPELTIAGEPLYNLIDISQIRRASEYKPEESVYLWINSLMEASRSSTNVSTFHDSDINKRPFLLTIYEDERPAAPVLSVEPYEEDAFLPQYTWSAKDSDLWYGLLMIDNKNIANQYHNALWRLHLNEDLTGYAKSDYNTLITMVGDKPSSTTLFDYFSTTAASVKFNGDRIDSGSGNVVVNASAKTITIAGYGDLTDTLSSGQFIDVIGMTESGNNLTNIEISSLSSTVIGVSSATTLVDETRAIGFVTVGNVSTKKITFTSPGVDLTTIFKADDKICVHHATDNSLVTGFGVEYTIATVAASHVTVDEQLTTNSEHTSALTIKNQATPPDDRYDGLAGNSKYFTGANENVLTFKSTAAVDLMPTNPPNKFSVSCHVIGADVTLSGTDYILYQRASNLAGTYDYNWYIAVNAQGNIVMSVQGNNVTDGADTDVVTTLTSASIMPTDGETPMHIAFTVDNELQAQNVKLFINGNLEASSGVARDSGSDNTSTRWARDLHISYQEGPLFVGAENQSGDNGFSGFIEEVVAYNDVIYPVNPREGKFLWTKPVEDFSGTGTTIAPTSYTARLFVKDYHNIRGSSASEVATSAMISYRKPVFDLRGA